MKSAPYGGVFLLKVVKFWVVQHNIGDFFFWISEFPLIISIIGSFFISMEKSDIIAVKLNGRDSMVAFHS